MVSRDRFGPLERVARLKADAELRRFAALRRQVAVIDARLDALDAEIEASAGIWAAASGLADIRRINGLTRAAVMDREDTLVLRSKLEPAHRSARQAAARAFGRAEAIAELARRSDAEVRRRRALRTEG